MTEKLQKPRDYEALHRPEIAAQLLVVCNFHGQEIENPLALGEEPILCNYFGERVPGKLRPFEARVYLR